MKFFSPTCRKIRPDKHQEKYSGVNQAMNFFSTRNRPFHLGPFPLEKLQRTEFEPDLAAASEMTPLAFNSENPESISHSIARFLALMDTVRDGNCNDIKAEIPEDLTERSNHFKAASYYFDASMVGITSLSPAHQLETPIRNPMIDGIRKELEEGQPTTYAAGVDAIYADILEATKKKYQNISSHKSALVFLIEYTRDPTSGEKGTEWIIGTQRERASLLTANVSVVIANYLRLLGYSARSHTQTTTEVDLNRLAVASGLCLVSDGKLVNPFVEDRFGLAAVTTDLELQPDMPLDVSRTGQETMSNKLAWQFGVGTGKRKSTSIPYKDREFRLGPHPFEKIKRVEEPTTLIDEARVPRFPKRADFFARALFGDMGKSVQEAAKGGFYVMKSPIGACARRALGALLLLQFGDARGPVSKSTECPEANADNIKAACYYLSTDAVGLSRAPEWAYYSHDSGGNELKPYHDNAISMLFDQGFDTMEGASGDDWISVAQSMRAYLRFSLIGGVIAEQIRRLGYSARVHSVLDSEVMQPPLLLLSGLGEVSRIGEVILNPFLGPRLKAGAVTTSMPMKHDKPIDFGLQRFCESCNKCARECPSGAITAGPKLMYNGYEIWKSDAEKCTRYRLTNSAGGMCGRCMKTCPWNLEGLFAEAPFRWVATNVPIMAKPLAKLDDYVGRGEINPIKKWWWDIELNRETGQYVLAKATHERGLSKDLDLKYEDQTLAVYPADKMPKPYPIVHILNREEGILRYKELLTPHEYRKRIEKGETHDLVPHAPKIEGEPPVIQVEVKEREDYSTDQFKVELSRKDGEPLPEFTAGSHVDVVIAPEFQRQFSLAGDPNDNSRYVLGVQNEKEGRGGSNLMYRVFRKGRKTHISLPRNHFELDQDGRFYLLMAGGIGVTPLISMAHELNRSGKSFELHYSARNHEQYAFSDELRKVEWASAVKFYFSDLNSRARLEEVIPGYHEGYLLYVCGSDRYMSSVLEMATQKGWPEESLAQEFFSVPEPPERENHPFNLNLTKSSLIVPVSKDESALEALAKKGIIVDTKCSDGICGVCHVNYSEGNVDHRDYVLSKREREGKMLLCCSRAVSKDETLSIDL